MLLLHIFILRIRKIKQYLNIKYSRISSKSLLQVICSRSLSSSHTYFALSQQVSNFSQNHWLLRMITEGYQPSEDRKNSSIMAWSLLQFRNLGNVGQEIKITAHVKISMQIYKIFIIHKDVHFIFSMFIKVVELARYKWSYQTQPSDTFIANQSLD